MGETKNDTANKIIRETKNNTANRIIEATKSNTPNEIAMKMKSDTKNKIAQETKSDTINEVTREAIKEIVRETLAESMQDTMQKTTNDVNCCLVKDILPLYIDDVVSEETKILVGKHLFHCADCKKEFEMLKQEVNISDNISTRLDKARPLQIFKQRMKKRKILVSILLSIMLLITTTALCNPAVINNGNPIPYIRGMLYLNNPVPFVKLSVNEGNYNLYMTKQSESSAMIQEIESVLGMKLEDCANSSYLFSNGEERILVETERYFGSYTLWKVLNRDISIP